MFFNTKSTKLTKIFFLVNIYSEDKSDDYSDEKRLDDLMLELAFELVKKLKKGILKNIWLMFLMFFTAETRRNAEMKYVMFLNTKGTKFTKIYFLYSKYEMDLHMPRP